MHKIFIRTLCNLRIVYGGHIRYNEYNERSATPRKGKLNNDRNECPTYSEFYGIIQTLKCMNVEYDIEWNPKNLDEMAAIVIFGQRFEV